MLKVITEAVIVNTQYCNYSRCLAHVSARVNVGLAGVILS
jgi:hypothetical protein